MEAQLNPLSAELIERIQELTPDQLFQELNSRPEGLAQDEIALRLGVYGPNVLQEVKGKPLILKFLANFTHVMAIMLWLAGIGAFIAKMPELGIAVWAVNIINGGFSFFQEFRAEKATQALRKILPSQSRVMRNGEEASIVAQDLVPGDVIFLQEGDNIPADCRLLNSADLRVNQSTLTGESHPVNRSA